MAATPIAIFVKDPDEMLDYSIDWSDYLQGDTISASAWTVAAGITGSATAFGSGLTTIWLSAGTDGVSYLIANKITTVGGRVVERTFQVSVRSR